MEIKHSKTQIKDLVDLYEDIRFIFSDSYKKILPLGYDDLKDARNLFYKFAIEATQTNVILFHLIGEHFGDLKLWEKQNFQNEEEKDKFIVNRLSFIITDLRESLFVNIFLRFENFIKLVSNSQGINGDKLNKLTKDLIKKLNLNNDYENLVDLVTYVRNTIHTEGFHTRQNVTISYKGKNFELKKDEPVTFYNEDFLHFLIEEVNELVLEIINSTDVKAVALIEHTYSGLKHIYEE